MKQQLTYNINTMATIVKSNGFVEETRPANGIDFTLSELQAIVGWFIEIVPLDEEHIMVVNEDGLLKGLDENNVATSLYHRKPNVQRTTL